MKMIFFKAQFKFSHPDQYTIRLIIPWFTILMIGISQSFLFCIPIIIFVYYTEQVQPLYFRNRHRKRRSSDVYGGPGRVLRVPALAQRGEDLRGEGRQGRRRRQHGAPRGALGPYSYMSLNQGCK